MSGSKAPVTVRITLELDREKSILTKPGGKAVFLAKSLIMNLRQLPDPLQVGETYDIVIPEWLARKEGLID